MLWASIIVFGLLFIIFANIGGRFEVDIHEQKVHFHRFGCLITYKLVFVWTEPDEYQTKSLHRRWVCGITGRTATGRRELAIERAWREAADMRNRGFYL